MQHYWDPVRLAVKKKLILSYKKDKENGYFLQTFLGKTVERQVLDYLVALHTGSTITLQNFVYSNSYIKEQKAIAKVKSQLSVHSYRTSNQKVGRYLGFKKELYQKMDKGQPMPLESVLKIQVQLGGSFYNYILWFEVEISDLNHRKMVKEVNNYADEFMQGDLVAGSDRFYSYYNHLLIMQRTIGELAKNYGGKNLPISKSDLFSWMFQGSGKQSALSQFKFLETLLAMEKQNYIEIVDIIEVSSVRLTIKPAQTVPTLNDWNKNFFNIASSLTYLDFLKKKLTSKKKSDSPADAVLNWNDLSLNTKSGWAKLDAIKHRFMITKPHFQVLKLLLEKNGGEVSYEQFFKAVAPIAADDPKYGKEFIRQKIRDIRKYFKLNRAINREQDIFYDTGNGFKLMKLSEGTITE